MDAPRRKVFTLLVEMRCNSYCVFCGQREVDEALEKTRARLGLSLPVTVYGAMRGRYTLETATAAGRIGFAFDDVALVAAAPRSPRDRVRAALFGALVVAPLATARRLRIVADTLSADGGEGWVGVFPFARPDAIVLEVSADGARGSIGSPSGGRP